ncbi:Uncharacterised protein [Mycobacteroides abscessus subsp. abscessus]|nr:Uncharacterised protein [Mycobacteroides abscessus subsp. abscessus]
MTICSARHVRPPATRTCSGTSTRARAWSKGSAMRPISARICATAAANSSAFDTSKPSCEECDLIGFTQNGNDRSMWSSASGSNGSKAQKAGTWSGTTSRCSTRLHSLCSVRSTLSRLGAGRSYSAARMGTSTLVGKSQCAMIASTGPSKARSSARHRSSRSSKSKVGAAISVS